MPKKRTTDEFIEEVKKIHGDKYDYSEIIYKGCNEKVCIICPKHGRVKMSPMRLLQGNICPLCGTEKRNLSNTERRLGNEEFIQRAKQIHGDKFDYSKVDYKNTTKNICIICHEKDRFGYEHGEFYQTPVSHLRGAGCPKCNNKQHRNTETFIMEANCVHNNRYDYSKTNFINTTTKICIVCREKDEDGNEHGDFYQNASSHLKGVGCPKCSGKYHMTTEEWIAKAKSIHGDTYDYSKTIYTNSNTLVKVICHKKDITGEEHGINYNYTTEEWAAKAKSIHGNTYDYSKAKYCDANTKVCIICHKHGEFWQKPIKHIGGQGCPKCKSSHLERDIRHFLRVNNINFEEQKTFEWLVYNTNLRIDFYLPDYNIAIECHGIQHFQPTNFTSFQNIEEKHLIDIFLALRKRDILKNKLCTKHGIKVYYYTNLENVEYPFELIKDKSILLKEILDNEKN